MIWLLNTPPISYIILPHDASVPVTFSFSEHTKRSPTPQEFYKHAFDIQAFYLAGSCSTVRSQLKYHLREDFLELPKQSLGPQLSCILSFHIFSNCDLLFSYLHVSLLLSCLSHQNVGKSLGTVSLFILLCPQQAIRLNRFSNIC